MSDNNDFHPRWVFNLWAYGAGDLRCAEDADYPASKLKRLWWTIRGNALTFLFGWWSAK